MWSRMHAPSRLLQDTSVRADNTSYLAWPSSLGKIPLPSKCELAYMNNGRCDHRVARISGTADAFRTSFKWQHGLVFMISGNAILGMHSPKAPP